MYVWLYLWSLSYDCHDNVVWVPELDLLYIEIHKYTLSCYVIVTFT
jgi:hypothetical protein